jgi:deazaflavin-dependent oxidoreductase (nitroreductase family)
MAFDRYLVRYTGSSLLNGVFARLNGFEARPALLLRTQGRKTGLWREVALPWFEAGNELLVVGSRGGLPTDPAWVCNLRENSEVELFVELELRSATARFAENEEYQALWSAVTAQVPTYLEYQKKCENLRQIPLVLFSYT